MYKGSLESSRIYEFKSSEINMFEKCCPSYSQVYFLHHSSESFPMRSQITSLSNSLLIFQSLLTWTLSLADCLLSCFSFTTPYILCFYEITLIFHHCSVLYISSAFNFPPLIFKLLKNTSWSIIRSRIWFYPT